MRTRRKVRFFAGILICAVLAPLWSQADWQGSAVVGRYGEFPPDGLYAASSAFPLNSMVDVTNPETGERARVVVVRELDDPGLFMVVSEAAGEQLGLDPDDSTTVQGTPVQLPGLTAVSPNQDLPFHPDPDVNPAATFGDPNAMLLMPPGRDESSDGAEVASAAEAPPEASPEPEPEPEPETEPEPEPETEPEIAAEPETTTEPEVADESPSVSVPVEPPESEPLPITELEEPDAPIEEADPDTTVPEVRIVVDVPEREDPPPNPVNVRTTIPETADGTPRIAEVEAPAAGDTGEDEVFLPLVALSDSDDDSAAEEPSPELVEAEPSVAEDEELRPGLIPENAVVSLEPADFRSPDPPPEPEPEAEPEPEPELDDATPDGVAEEDRDPDGDAETRRARAEPEPEPEPETQPEPELAAEAPAVAPDDGGLAALPLVDRLDSGSAYVQVAAFSTPQRVRRTIDTLGGGWPVAVMAQKSGDRSVYRLYVGPLAEDEKGSVLFRVRNEGFRDAFVR